MIDDRFLRGRKQDKTLFEWRIDVTTCKRPTNRQTDLVSDRLQELLKWLFATKNYKED